MIHELISSERATKSFKRSDRTYKESLGLVLLDALFDLMPAFPGLKHFYKFSNLSQMIGGEELDLLCIIIPVITPLLVSAVPFALSYARALIDFILVCNYKVQNQETLDYFHQYLIRLDAYKDTFAKYRLVGKDGDAYWHYPKFHALYHYVEFIIQFGAANGYDTAFIEAPH